MRPRFTRDAYLRSPIAQIVQIAAAWAGGWLFTQMGVPASWLSGAVVAVMMLGRFGYGVIMPRALTETAMLVSGVVMGAGMTPDTLAAIGTYPLSLALLVAAIVATTLASSLVLMRGFGWRRDDAILATVPGALTAVMTIAVERRLDVPGIGIVQSTRLLFLIIVLPFAVKLLGDTGAPFLGGGPTTVSPAALAALLVGGLAVGALFARLRLAAPLLLGATLASGLAHVTGAVPGHLPEPVAELGFVLIGVFIAQRFNTLDLAAMRQLVPAALAAFVVGMAVAGGFAALAVIAAGAPLGDALVAFAPGGLEAMVVLALVMGLDPLYVGTHHLVRFLGIGFALPIAFRGGEPPPPEPEEALRTQPPGER